MVVEQENLLRTRNRPISERLVSKVAAQEGVEPTKLPTPLYDSINPDALDDLIESIAGEGRVDFSYHGYHVTVTSDGEISLDGARSTR